MVDDPDTEADDRTSMNLVTVILSAEEKCDDAEE